MSDETTSIPDNCDIVFLLVGPLTSKLHGKWISVKNKFYMKADFQEFKQSFKLIYDDDKLIFDVNNTPIKKWTYEEIKDIIKVGERLFSCKVNGGSIPFCINGYLRNHFVKDEQE